jgi:hypothetical protein
MITSTEPRPRFRRPRASARSGTHAGGAGEKATTDPIVVAVDNARAA